MKQLSLNDNIFKEMYENEDIHDGLFPNVATNIAVNFVKKIAIEFANFVDNGSKWDVTEEDFQQFLKQKYK